MNGGRGNRRAEEPGERLSPLCQKGPRYIPELSWEIHEDPATHSHVALNHECRASSTTSISRYFQRFERRSRSPNARTSALVTSISAVGSNSMNWWIDGREVQTVVVVYWSACS